jgi:hypothetical protein
MEWNQYITIESRVYIVISAMLRYNFGPECLAGFNLSVNRKTNALFLAGSAIVFLIAKLRICPVPAGTAPPFLSPPPCWVSVWIALVGPVLLNNTRRATLLFTIIVLYIIMVYINNITILHTWCRRVCLAVLGEGLTTHTTGQLAVED